MKTVTERTETTVAAWVAGEDIACGDFVTVMNDVAELASFLWDNSAVAFAPDELVRIRYMADDAGQPYKVIGVCLPFVYVKTHCNSLVTLDTRRRQLVRLDYECARTVWKFLKSASRKRRN